MGRKSYTQSAVADIKQQIATLAQTPHAGRALQIRDVVAEIFQEVIAARTAGYSLEDPGSGKPGRPNGFAVDIPATPAID